MSFIVFHYDTQATSTFHLTRNLNISLPAANEVCEGYVFTRICHSVHRGWRAWQGGGVRGGGGMRGRGDAWQGGHAPPPPDTKRYGDTVNERVVRILLECILVKIYRKFSSFWRNAHCGTRGNVPSN